VSGKIVVCRECGHQLGKKAEFCFRHPKAIVDTIIPSRSGTPTTPNDRRGRPMVTITLSPEGLAELDKRRGDVPRGTFVEWLLSNVPHKTTKAPTQP
jgi:hypothetical protein